jgi:extracellular elastinolytic metalloproteinase
MSMIRRSPRSVRVLLPVLLIVAVTVPLVSSTIATGAAKPAVAVSTLGDLDARVGTVLPTAAQKNAANALGAHVTWNRFGTPASLIKYGGYLGTGLTGSAVNAARTWLRSHAALFRLTTADVNGLSLVNDSLLSDGASHAVMFTQVFGSLAATQDGLVIVGIKQGKVAYVSSSLAGHQAAPAPATLTPQQAWLAAAASIGLPAAPGDISGVHSANGWTVFSVAGFETPSLGVAKNAATIGQRARLVALPTYTQGVRAAFEVDVLRNSPGLPVVGDVIFVDARTGDVLVRVNAVDTEGENVQPAAAASGFFTGTTGTNLQDALCGPDIAIAVDLPTDQRVDVVATANVPADDIVIKLYRPNNTLASSADTATSPEALDYTFLPGDTSGTWNARVCEFSNVSNFSYAGFFQVSTVNTSNAFPFPPQWNFFTSNPPLPGGALHPPFVYPNTDTRVHACWTLSDPGAPPECQLDLTPNVGDTNLASRVPWDHNVQTNLPNFQTDGNNAFTAETWDAALTPGATSQRPIDLDRTYGFLELADPQSATGALEGWTNSWNQNRCDYLVAQTPAENNIDVMAAVTSLHAGHNRMHDFAYNLGFTERNFNMQLNNFGQTAPGPYPFGREGDPEIGDAQNGATLPVAAGLTRDNANQVTLQDGIPGITNQYLFQPIAGGFYGPCADGDLDTSIYGHEYTHAISNRMVGGPDDGLTGFQAGAMGESWSDQVAVEYLNEYHFVSTAGGVNPFAVGAYATGNKQRAIRDYGMNTSPLNYSDIGFDIACDASLVGPPVEPDCDVPEGEVHADGEIWSAIGYDLRQALIQKYNATYPASDLALQKRCADGNLPADHCPGNRRWIQIMFDAFLLQQGDTDMLTARDAYLAADQLTFNGANQKTLWHVFAERGMGSCSLDPTNACQATRSAFTNGTEDREPRPSFESPLEGEKTVNFTARSSGSGAAVPANILVGRYQARVTPIADTDGATALSNTARFVPGTYSIIVQAKGYGLKRFQLVASGTATSNVSMTLTPNFASLTNGATATGDGTNQSDLIDDSEATTWDVADTGTNVNVARPQVTVE